MFGVEVGGAESHLRLLEDGLFRLSNATNLIIFYEEVPVLGLSVPVDLLLQTLIRFSFSQHLIVRVGHAVIAGLPGVIRGGFVKVVLGLSNDLVKRLLALLVHEVIGRFF